MIIGIDLGTTNSLVAVWRDGQAQLIQNSLGEVLTPSCVSLDADGSVLVGGRARAPADASGPHRRRVQALHGQRPHDPPGHARVPARRSCRR